VVIYHSRPEESEDFIAQRQRFAGAPHDPWTVRAIAASYPYTRHRQAQHYRRQADVCRAAGDEAGACALEARATALRHEPRDPSTPDTP
jgi:hypothetical protein